MSCTYCYKGFALPGEPKGTMVGQDYFTAAPNDVTQRTKAIVLLTDFFGLPLPNPRIVADHLAEQVGVDVWVPDFFNGTYPVTSIYAASADIEALLLSGKPPADANTLEPLFPDRAGVKISGLRLMKFIIKFIPSVPRMIACRPSVVDARVHEARDHSPCAAWPCP
jgi:carboxymethylenebutenolidase